MNIHLGIPQIILIILYIISVGSHAIRHGEPMKMNYNFWTALIAFAIVLALLAWGGFFT